MEYTENGVECSSTVSVCFKNHFCLQKSGANLTLLGFHLHIYSGPLLLKRPKYLHVKELATKYVPADCMKFYDRLTCQEEQ